MSTPPHSPPFPPAGSRGRACAATAVIPGRASWSQRDVLTAGDLIWPVFITEGKGQHVPIASMPGVFRHSVDTLVEAVQEAAALGIPAIALFPEVDAALKDARCARGDQSRQSDLPRRARREDGRARDGHRSATWRWTRSTGDGHDGLVIDDDVDNDLTVAILCRQALVQAEAGCDVIAPSDMMDGRVGSIRDALDGAGHQRVQIMSYAAKYASAFYGPFRDAIGTKAVLKGDKKTYQMDPANADEAIREVALDIEEGADMVMVKPGMPYLDIVRRVKDTFGIPTFAYQVSGEYAMLKGAAQQWLARQRPRGAGKPGRLQARRAPTAC